MNWSWRLFLFFSSFWAVAADHRKVEAFWLSGRLPCVSPDTGSEILVLKSLLCPRLAISSWVMDQTFNLRILVSKMGIIRPTCPQSYCEDVRQVMESLALVWFCALLVPALWDFTIENVTSMPGCPWRGIGLQRPVCYACGWVDSKSTRQGALRFPCPSLGPRWLTRCSF